MIAHPLQNNGNRCCFSAEAEDLPDKKKVARQAQKFRQPETGQLTARPKPQESMEILKVFLFEGKRKKKIEAKSAPEAKGRSQAGCSEAKAPPQPLQSQFSLPSPRLPSARFASAWAAFKSLGLQQAALDRPSARGGAAQPKPGRQRCAFCSAESMAGVCAGPGGRGRAPDASSSASSPSPNAKAPRKAKQQRHPRRPPPEAPLKQACAATYEQADARASKPTPRRSGAGCGTARGGGRLLLFSGGKANGRGQGRPTSPSVGRLAPTQLTSGRLSASSLFWGTKNKLRRVYGEGVACKAVTDLLPP